ncbi:MAG: L,D-transpeptidase [Gemmatimonadaceae bacterium]|nr:L,D-transpeptidase [Gemmatimonadaceae bacterium]
MRISVVFLALAASTACHRAVIAQEPPAQPAGTDWVTISPNGRPVISAGTSRATEEKKEETTVLKFRSRQDSLEWASARRVASNANAFRVVVSIKDRQLWVIDKSGDTLRAADVAVAKDEVLNYNGRTWSFKTPRGTRTVRFKQEDPVWTPPDWHYAEVARDYNLKMRQLPLRGSVKLKDGSLLSVRDSLVGITKPGTSWSELPFDYEVVFEGTLFVPPIGTKNRRIEGQLGKYKLDLGDGYMLHGTPHQHTVGNAVTHGCVRLRDEDIEWLYHNVPVGTRVYLY